MSQNHTRINKEATPESTKKPHRIIIGINRVIDFNLKKTEISGFLFQNHIVCYVVKISQMSGKKWFLQQKRLQKIVLTASKTYIRLISLTIQFHPKFLRNEIKTIIPRLTWFSFFAPALMRLFVSILFSDERYVKTAIFNRFRAHDFNFMFKTQTCVESNRAHHSFWW